MNYAKLMGPSLFKIMKKARKWIVYETINGKMDLDGL
jgi:hypothetical protein